MSVFASSSSSDSSSVESEVFISFRGSDTRYAFTSHLYEALRQRKIVTFIDYKISSGDRISSALLDAIKKSKAAVVIFSKDYASSPWCLDELVEILKWNKIVIPVFYHVNPTDVEEQTGSYAESFAVHKTKGVHDQTLQNWKKALKDASHDKGYVTADIRDEACLTKKIVDDIWKKLRDTHKIKHKNLVGIESKVEEIISLLKIGSGDVCYVGIWGTGGIGKTTLASAVFNEIRTQFDGSSFLGNIRERLGTAVGLNGLRQQLYADISGEKSGKIFDDVRLNFFLSRKKVLIVFDDVTDIEQIENILGEVDEFNIESRFIITTWDKQILRNYGCKEGKIYKVNGLCDKEALQLFSRFAFKQEHPEEEYTELSRKTVDYAKGSPLALKVLGSSLFSKSILEWESAIEQLKRAPNKKIQGVLKVSFDGLDYEQKKVFLDVAFFFKGCSRKGIADIYDYNIEFTLGILIDRCLVSIDSYGGITMHDLLQEMGWQIVREESIENPGERSRLCHPDDIYQVLTRNEGTRAIRGISFNMSATREIHINKNSFIKMSELWFLEFYSSFYNSFTKKRLSCSKDFQCVSTKLRFLRWDYYPMKSLQSRFSLENLVILEMLWSEVEQLWDGVQPLPNLKEIDFHFSPNLTAIPDLSLAPKVEEIKLSGCRNLTSFPPCDHMKSLYELDLSHCKKFVAIPELSCNISRLDLGGTGITHLPSSIGNLSQLSFLDLSHCHELSSVPKEISNLKSIRCLDLSYCHKLQFLPDELPRSLKYLRARGCSSLKAVPYSLSILLATTEDVSFSECYMLDKDEFTTIIQEALLGIQQLPFQERPAQVREEDEDEQEVSLVECSGCEIPKFFEFQHLGSMISMELPYEMVGGKIVGLVFFVVHKPSQFDGPLGVDYRGSLFIKFHCKTTFENSECSIIRDEFAIQVSVDISKEAAEDDSTVVIVGYTNASYHRKFPSQYQSILLELEFSVPGGEVEKCGFQLFSVPVSEEERKGTSSSSSEEKQLERSPKRLKVS